MELSESNQDHLKLKEIEVVESEVSTEISQGLYYLTWGMKEF